MKVWVVVDKKGKPFIKYGHGAYYTRKSLAKLYCEGWNEEKVSGYSIKRMELREVKG